jgi:hypothetical protein
VLRVLVCSGLLTLAACAAPPPRSALPTRLDCTQAALAYMTASEAMQVCTGGRNSGSDCALNLNDLKQLHLLRAKAEVACAD